MEEPLVRYILAALAALALLWVLAKLLFDWEKDERIVTEKRVPAPKPRPVQKPAAPRPQKVAIPVAAPKPAARPDDLTKIEGIGPAVQKVLNSNGIKTFAQLASKNGDTVSKIMLGAGSRFQMHSKSAQSWPRQAALADKGDWDALQKLQDSLTAGK